MKTIDISDLEAIWVFAYQLCELQIATPPKQRIYACLSFRVYSITFPSPFTLTWPTPSPSASNLEYFGEATDTVEAMAIKNSTTTFAQSWSSTQGLLVRVEVFILFSALSGSLLSCLAHVGGGIAMGFSASSCGRCTRSSPCLAPTPSDCCRKVPSVRRCSSRGAPSSYSSK